MIARTRTRAALPLMLIALLAALLAGPTAVAAHANPVRALPAAEAVDLAPALAADGTFRGSPAVAGTVDPHAWTFVSNLAAGQPPRFKPAAAATTPIGPWSAVGPAIAGDGALNDSVWSIVVSGGNVYVGGDFTDAAGILAADYVAKWNGTAWSALGSLDGDGALDFSVSVLALSGTDLYVGGDFTDAGGIDEADYIAKWNGTAWSALGSNGSADGALDSSV